MNIMCTPILNIKIEETFTTNNRVHSFQSQKKLRHFKGAENGFLQRKIYTYRNNWLQLVHQMKHYRLPKQILEHHPTGR
jgi:hypothetical protein